MIRLVTKLNTVIVFIGLLSLQNLISISAHAQDGEFGSLSINQLLNEAESLRFKDQQKSLRLANEILRRAKANNHNLLSAQTHSLLGWLSHELQNNNEAKHHYLQASRIFTALDDIENQIDNAFEYIELLFLEDNHEIAYKNLDELLPIAYDHGDDSLTSRLIMLKANSLYYQKRYQESELVFLHALEYLTAQDSATQTNRGEAYHQMGQIFKHLKDFKKSGDLHQQALIVHTELNDPSLIARSLKNVGIAEYKQNNILTSLDYTIRGIKVQEQINEPSKHAELLVLAGSIYRQLNRYETSLEYLDKALQMYRELADVGKIAESLNQMGLLYNRLKEYDEARALYQQSIELPYDRVPAKTLAAAYREIGVYEKRAGNYEVAMEFATRAHNTFLEINDISKATITARNIGEIYVAMGDKIQAIKYFNDALAYAEQTGSTKNRVKILNKLGFAVLRDDIDAAYEVFKRSLSISENSDYYPEKSSTLRELMKIERARGNPVESLRYAEDLIQVNKVIYDEHEKSKIATAKASLDSHIMETELLSLREKVKFDQLTLAKQNSEIEIAQQANQISELELVKNRYANFLLIALLVLCIGSAIYIYRIFVASKQRNIELDYLATHDPLTNCLNRRGLFNIIDKKFAERRASEHYSIIMADIDRFKEVNDVYGHDAGDQVLIEVVKVFKESIRKSDVAARYGGEEFCIALADTSLEQALDIAEKMRKSVEESKFNDISITCSFGIATVEKETDNPSKLITRADKALYFSKSNGRNQVNAWDINLRAEQSAPLVVVK